MARISSGLFFIADKVTVDAYSEPRADCIWLPQAFAVVGWDKKSPQSTDQQAQTSKLQKELRKARKIALDGLR